MLNPNPISESHHTAFCDQSKDRRDRYDWLVIRSDTPVGCVNIADIDLINHHCRWGFFVDPKRLGHGAGKIMLHYLLGIIFQTIGLDCVRAEVFADNARGLRIHTFLGFQQDGVMRNYRYLAPRE